MSEPQHHFSLDMSMMDPIQPEPPPQIDTCCRAPKTGRFCEPPRTVHSMARAMGLKVEYGTSGGTRYLSPEGNPVPISRIKMTMESLRPASGRRR